MHVHNHRFTRLTNSFAKKFENHAHTVATFAFWHNSVRTHKSLRVTMASGLFETVMDWAEIMAMMDADAQAPEGSAPAVRTASPLAISLT
jgi:hypothetical protein